MSTEKNTIVTLNELEKEFGVRLITHIKNSGPAGARSTGISHAKYDWITFIESDDLWPPDKINNIYAVILQKPDSVWIAGRYIFLLPGGIIKCTEHINQILGKFSKEGKSVRLYHPELTKLLARNWLHIGASAFKRSLIIEAGGFNPNLRFGEDWLLCLKISAIAPMDYIEKDSYILRRQMVSMMRSKERMSFELLKAGRLARRDPLLKEAYQRGLIRHYTLSAADLALIRRGRGDHHRLGYALMLCYLRHPGRVLRAGEIPDPSLVSFVADQIDVLPDSLVSYLASEQNRRRHSASLLNRLGVRTFGPKAANELSAWLLPHAIENERLLDLAALAMEECRQRGIIVPAPARLERICIEVRHKARRETERRLTDGLSTDQRRGLDALTARRLETSQSWLAWLRQMPESAKPGSMIGLIERLAHVRAIGLAPARGHFVNQARLAQLAREAGRMTVQHIADYERRRRHATLTAITLDLAANLTDHAIDLFERLIGAMFRKAEGKHARDFQADGRAIKACAAEWNRKAA